MNWVADNTLRTMTQSNNHKTAFLPWIQDREFRNCSNLRVFIVCSFMDLGIELVVMPMYSAKRQHRILQQMRDRESIKDSSIDRPLLLQRLDISVIESVQLRTPSIWYNSNTS
jgi:hypothetical protein